MAEEITLKVNVETGKAVTNLGNLEKATKGVTQATKQADKGAATLEQQFDTLNKEIKEGPVNIRRMNKQIQEYQAIALEAGRTSPLGKKAIAEAAQMKDRYNDITAEVNRLANDGVKMQAALDIGTTVIAGYAAFQGVMAIAGVDSEKYRETLIKLQGAQSLLMGIETLRKNLEKESTVVLMAKNAQEKAGIIITKLKTFVTTGATAATKLLRLAMLSLPFVAIGAAIIALVSYWDDFVGAIKNGLSWMGLYDDSAEKSAAKEKARVEKEMQQRELRLKQIENSAKREQSIHDNRINELDNEIKIAKSLGKNTIELERQKLQAIIDSTKIQNKLSDERIALKIKEIEANFLLLDSINDMAFASEKAVADAEIAKENGLQLIEDLKQERITSTQAVKNAEIDLLAFENDTAKSRSDKRKQTNKEILKAETDLSNAKLKQRAEDSLDAEEKKNILIQIEEQKLKQQLALNDKKKKVDKMSAAELKLLVYNTEQAIDKIREDFAQKEIDRQIKLKIQEQETLNELLLSVEELENAHFNRMTEDQKRNEEIEINAIYDKYNAQILALQELGESTKLLEEAQGADIAEIKKKYSDQEIADARAVKDAKTQMALDGLNAVMSLTSAFAKDNEKSQKKAFEINKKLQIAMALIQTYQGVQAIFASAAANPATILFPAQPFIAAGIALASGLANVQNIRKQKFSGGSAGGSFGGGVPGGGGAAPRIEPVTNTSTLVPQEDQKVYVTETDISDTQNKISVIEAQSTF